MEEDPFSAILCTSDSVSLCTMSKSLWPTLSCWRGAVVQGLSMLQGEHWKRYWGLSKSGSGQRQARENRTAPYQVGPGGADWMWSRTITRSGVEPELGRMRLSRTRAAVRLDRTRGSLVEVSCVLVELVWGRPEGVKGSTQCVKGVD